MLANDSNPDGDTLVGPTSKVGPFHGTISIGAGGNVTYTPFSNFYNGTDTWTYTVTDGHGGSTDGVLTITVHNAAPVANPDSTSTHGDPVTLNVVTNDTDADGDTLTVTSGNGGAQHGSVTNNGDGTDHLRAGARL